MPSSHLFRGRCSMIEAICGCGQTWVRAESARELGTICRQCRRALSIACAEQLPEGAGGADFDAYLEVVSGPARVRERIFLGGVLPITLGSSASAHVRLPGESIPRRHCHL